MANIRAIHSVGNSIVTYLRNTYPEAAGGAAMPACGFALLSMAEMAAPPDVGTRLSLALYRVTVNEHQRQQRPDRLSTAQPAPLGLDLHFLLTAWGGTASDEQVPLAWALRQLYLHPILDGSSLSPEAGWAPDEVIQIVPAELSNEDLVRLWGVLAPSYRLSVSYVARLVRLDPDPVADARPVVASRFSHGAVQGPGGPA